MPKKIYMNIPVPPDVYTEVRKVADANGRTMGGQVKMWARECPHPAGKRILLGHTIVLYPPAGKVTVDVKIWQCQECGRLIVLPADGFDGDQRAVATETVQP